MEKITAEMLEGLVVKYRTGTGTNDISFTIQKRKRTDNHWGFYTKPTNKTAYFLKEETSILTNIANGYYVVVVKPDGGNNYPIY